MAAQTNANEGAQTQTITDLSLNQRMPWWGGKKRGVENLANDTPPKKGFWTPLVRYVFHPPSGLSALFFLYKNPRQSRPEALLEGSKNFRESAFSGTFSSPHTFCTPPCHGPRMRTQHGDKRAQTQANEDTRKQTQNRITPPSLHHCLWQLSLDQ